jgi:predicted DNA-binding transcriptional regulator AlpA
METFLTWNEVLDLLVNQNKIKDNPLGRLHSMLIEKQFPLPVKDKRGLIVFIKSEVDNRFLSKSKRVRKEKISGGYKGNNVS